ncbi:MAG: hypothetical protein ACRDJ5_07340, partial [Actinomycetota bacterium]
MTLRKIVIVGLATLVVAGLGAGALVAAHVTRRGVRRVTDLEAALDAARFSIDKARSEAERSGSELVDLEAALEDSEAGIRELKGRIRAGRERTTRLRGELSFLRGVQRDLSRAEDRLLA